MADRPILFSAPMVRALLAGTKTQTRREIKPRGNRPSLFNGDWSDSYVLEPGNESWRRQDIRVATGDRLWVKETWAPLTALTHNDPGTQAIADGGFYRADEGTVDGEVSKWKSSIFMPRHASRLTLTVTDVKVERLQDISEDDAAAEGVPTDEDYAGSFAKEYCDRCGGSGLHGAFGAGYGVTEVDCAECETPKLRHRNLWNHINGEGAWQANPWVVAYSFSVQHGNIDQIAKVAA